MDDTAWSAAAIVQHADTIEAIHVDYVQAGADVITTNTFATTRYVLESIGLGDKVEEINAASVRAARRATESAGDSRKVWIAGSISPMAPGLDSDRRPSPEAAEGYFRELAEYLAATQVDCILLEMVRDAAYGASMMRAAKAVGLPVWAGFSCVIGDNGTVMSRHGVGEPAPLAAILRKLLPLEPDLVAVMHTNVEDMPAALQVVRKFWNGPLGAYPHSGSFVMPHWDFNSVMAPGEYAREMLGLIERFNLSVVGGCCGIGPKHIAELRHAVDGNAARLGKVR